MLALFSGLNIFLTCQLPLNHMGTCMMAGFGKSLNVAETFWDVRNPPCIESP